MERTLLAVASIAVVWAGIGPAASAQDVAAAPPIVPAIDLAPAIPAEPGPVARWRGGILFDEAFRSAIRLHVVDDQEVARTLSDLTLGATVLTAVGVEGLAAPLAQGDGELALRASFAHVLALGVTIAAGELVKRLVLRARPYERECRDDPDRHGCDGEDRNFSFYSLHTGVAFTSAGFSCSMHLGRGLYGDLAADATACGLSLALATTTGLLRALSDRHYLSDILIGGALGALVGVLLPLALVPERDPGPTPAATQTLTDLAGRVPTPIGFSFGGTF